MRKPPVPTPEDFEAVYGADTISLFAGPGGVDEGACILGADAVRALGTHVGIELDADACATARANGHARVQGDVRAFDPALTRARGLVVTPPCPPWSSSGTRAGLNVDAQTVDDAITCMGAGCGCEHDDVMDRCTDPRSGLVVEAARWALRMPNIEWLLCEQVPGVEPLWESLTAELVCSYVDGPDVEDGEPGEEVLVGPGWEWTQVVTFDARHLGVSRRRRTFLLARRYAPSRHGVYVSGDVVPSQRLALELGWPEDERICTRGNRKTSGGNWFSAAGIGWCMTGKSGRCWYRESTGESMTVEEVGYAQGFPPGYVWEGRSRTSRAQQAGDVVAPPAAAVALGAVLDIDWRARLVEWSARRTTPFGAPREDVVHGVDLVDALGRPVLFAMAS